MGDFNYTVHIYSIIKILFHCALISLCFMPQAVPFMPQAVPFMPQALPCLPRCRTTVGQENDRVHSPGKGPGKSPVKEYGKDRITGC